MFLSTEKGKNLFLFVIFLIFVLLLDSAAFLEYNFVNKVQRRHIVMIFYYVRHGDPIYNPDQLTPLGHRQAESVSRFMAGCKIDKIFSSTSTRAIQTATPTAEVLKKEITQLDFTNEKYAWERFSVECADGKRRWIEQSDQFRNILVSPEVFALGDKWYEHPDLAKFNFGEHFDFFRNQIDEFFASLGYEHDRKNRLFHATRPNDDNVALFAHGGFGGIFLSSILDIPYPQFATRISICHTGVTVIHFSDKQGDTIPVVSQLSGTPHLFADRLPTAYYK